MIRRHPSRGSSVAVLCVALLAATPAAATKGQRCEEILPRDECEALRAVLNKKVADLWERKDAQGRSLQRGAYSRSVVPVDAETLQVTFHEDTVREDGSLLTERKRLTLKRAGGKWAIVGEEVEDRLVGVFRPVMGDETFHRFDKIDLELEGLHVSGGAGFLFRDFVLGKPAGFVLVADGLRYEYTPPAEATRQYFSVYRYYKNKARDDLEFTPRFASVLCDPESCERLLRDGFSGLRDVDRTQASEELLRLHADYEGRYRRALDQNPFAGFRTEVPPDRRTIWIGLNKKGREILWDVGIYGDFFLGLVGGGTPELGDHSLLLAWDSWAPKDVQLWVTRLGMWDTWFGPILAYHSRALRESGASPYELELRDDPEARDYDMQALHGEVELGLGDAELQRSDVTYRFRAKRDLERVPFFIARENLIGEERRELRNPTMSVDSIQDGEGNELTWVKQGPVTGLVVLRQPVKAGETFTLRMQFQTRGTVTKVNPSFSYVARGGWLPFVRFGDFIDDVQLTVKVPARYRVLGIGRKVEDKVEGDVRITRWMTDSPVEFPSVTFGEYISDTPDVEAKKRDGTKIPVEVFVDKVSIQTVKLEEPTNVDEFQKDITAFEAGARGIRARQLKAIAQQAANSLNLYREIFQIDYPYGKLDLVADPLGFLYGQAPSSLIYLGAFVFRGEGALASLGGGTQTAKFLKSVVAHEVGHQWWGSIVANANTWNYWFVESLAEYASALFMENAFSKQEYLEKVEEWRHNVLETDMTTSVQDASGLASPDPFNYTSAVYNKGPFAFHVLRMTFGDEKLFAFLRALAQKLKSKEIVTLDMQRVAEEVYQVPMGWFFDQWIRGVAIPEFTVDYRTRRTEDGKWLVEGVVRQRLAIGKDRFPVEGQYYLGVGRVVVTGRKSKQEYATQIRVEGPESPFRFKVPEEPLEIAFNKYGDMLSYPVQTRE